MIDTLNARFSAPLQDFYHRRIIVWIDDNGEFEESAREMTLDNARVLVMQRDHMFEIRRQTEVDYADENLLIYCPLHFDKPEDNWLMDVFMYSEAFRADYWSRVFDELNIENTREIRDYIRTVTGFFNQKGSKDRKARLKALKAKYSDANELQTGIFCVLCKLKTFGMGEVTKAVLAADEEDSPLKTIEQYCGEDAFWEAMTQEYGYSGKHEVKLLASHILASAAMMNGELNVSGLSGSAAYAIPAYGLFVAWLREDREALLRVCLETERYDKTDKEVVEGEVLEYKRRHAVVRTPRHDPRAIFMPLNVLGRDDLTGVFPRGGRRFRLQGGSGTYMHGGLSLQELMVPLIRYQNKKSGQKGFTAITKTEILLLGDNRKISNNIFTLAFYQKSPCVGKVQSRQALVRFEDCRGEVISDEHRVIGNSASVENNERVTKVTFHLLGSGYDRNTDYWLVMKDAEDGSELARIVFKIDVVFGLDFDF